MARAFFRLPGLSFDRPLALGKGRFLPPGHADFELRLALEREATNDGMRDYQSVVADLLRDWGEDSVLELHLPASDSGVVSEAVNQVAEETMAAFRFFAREHIRVNVDAHRFGLVGEMANQIRDYILLWDQPDRSKPLTAAGWRHIDGAVPLQFTDAVLDDVEGSDAFAFVSKQLAADGSMRSLTGSRAITAINMLSVAFRSLDATQRVLCAAIAVETLLSDADRGSQAMRVARRAAFLRCGGDCSTGKMLCPYLATDRDMGALGQELLATQKRGEEWRCSAYLRIAAPEAAVAALTDPPLFHARNQAAHEGRVDLTEQQVKRLVWNAERTVMAALRWFATSNADLAGLDNLIAAAVTVARTAAAPI